MARTHYSRFVGRNNAGLRKQIREAVAGHRCGDANAASVLALGATVALTAQGKSTLAEAAEDYRRTGAGQQTCDCDGCFAGNLHSVSLSAR
jgi:hypothetical protein